MEMKFVIVEDEKIAADRLNKLLKAIRPGWQFVERLDSIEDSVSFFSGSPDIDLIFMDIQLSDGLCFEVFKQINIEIPVIFTTAYNQYAIEAFQVNSIDYLLKPIDPDKLEHAIMKFEKNQGKQTPGVIDHNILNAMLQKMNQSYKERFVIKVGEHIKIVNIEDVNFFFSEDKVTYLMTNEGRRLILDHTLDKIEEMIDPSVFYRINRKFIVNEKAIKDIIAYTNSRLRLDLAYGKEFDTIVARERVQDFKSWLDK